MQALRPRVYGSRLAAGVVLWPTALWAAFVQSLRRPRLVVGLAFAMMLGGCLASDTGLDGWSWITFEGDTYRARGYSPVIPDGSLMVIGTTTETNHGEEADHAEVYAIEGVDSAIAVAAVIFPAEGVGEGAPPGELTMYLREGVSEYPPEACSYFDPEAVGVHGPLTPEECR